jgi:hypothetical protein
MQYEYRFEDVDVRQDSKAYRHAVETFAADGWRLVQVLVEMPAAVPASIVVILEREKC